MPCYRCGARQVDPDRGESPWRRGVRGDRQVLICPGCQGSFDWMSDLDHCPVCASVHLVRRLGEAECRDCGSVGAAAGAPLPGLSRPAEAAATHGLAEEVEHALARVLGRTVGGGRRLPQTSSEGWAR
jgi:hypothetical protein